MTVTFRNALPTDAATLGKLGARSFTETFGHLYSPENLALFLANHDKEKWRTELADPAFSVLVGEADDDAVAYAKLGPPSLPFTPRGTAIELRQFYVLDGWHGQGVAQEMMAWVLVASRRRGADALYLSVFTDNARARRFYKKYGFEAVGRYDFMVGTHADEDIVMRLAL